MLVAGDEFRRTQHGNNNAYCQDNDISWLNWKLLEKNEEIFRFCKVLIDFRKNQPAVRRPHYLTGQANAHSDLPDVSWYSAVGTAVDWQSHDLPMICVLTAPLCSEDVNQLGHDVLIMFNSTTHGCQYSIPAISKVKKWRKFLDTAADFPEDIFPDLDGPKLPANGCHTLPGKSMAVFVSE